MAQAQSASSRGRRGPGVALAAIRPKQSMRQRTHASVIGFERVTSEGRTYTAYRIQIQSPVKTYSILRRYNDFVALQTSLENDPTVVGVELPKMPPKKWFGNDSLQTLEKRKTAFNKYLEHCRSKAKLRHSTAYLGFLDADPDDEKLHSSPAISPIRSVAAASAPAPAPAPASSSSAHERKSDRITPLPTPADLSRRGARATRDTGAGAGVGAGAGAGAGAGSPAPAPAAAPATRAAVKRPPKTESERAALRTIAQAGGVVPTAGPQHTESERAALQVLGDGAGAARSTPAAGPQRTESERAALQLIASGNPGPQPVTPQLKQAVTLLREGVRVFKFPRNGKKPEVRYVFLDTATQGEIAAATRKMGGAPDVHLHTLGLWDGSRIMVSKNKVRAARSQSDDRVPTVKGKHLLLGEITHVARGKDTPVFQGNPKAADVSSSMCLSLVTDARSFDLQFDSSVLRETFALAVEHVLDTLRSKK